MIDIKTISLSLVIINIFLSVILLIAWRVQKVYAGFGCWVLANAALALGHTFLVLLRDAVPLLIALLLGNLLFLLAAWLRLEGLYRFLGREYRRAPHFLLGVIVLTGFWYFSDDLIWRTVILSGVLAFYLFRMTSILISSARDQNRVLYRYLAALFFIYGLLISSRIFLALAAPSQIVVPQSTAANIVFFPMIMLLDIGITFAFLLLNDRRVVLELEQTEQDRERVLSEIHLLLESTGEGIYGTDQEGRCTFINKSGATMLGFRPEEIIGKNMHDLIHHRHSDGSVYLIQECPMHRTLQEGQTFCAVDEVLWRKDGTPLPVEYTSFPIREGEAITGVVVTFQDITERKRAMDALRESESRYRELVQNANSVIIRYNRDGILTFFNEFAQTFFGYSVNEAVGRHVSFLVPERESTGRDLGALIQDIAGHPERFVNNINENICRDGRRVWMAWTNKPILDDRGQVAEILAVGLDLTERKRAEDEVRRLNTELEQRVHDRTEQLEAANRELEGFGYSVSHDLRSPLRHITGFVNLLMKRMPDRLDEKGRHYLEVISDSALKMGKLIDDILSFSRMGRVEMKMECVRMDLLLTEVLQEIQPVWQGREVTFTINPLPEVEGDPALLKMVWTNLVSNAVKFTGRRPRAVIEIGWLPDRPEEEVFFVRDDGAGFNMQYQDKLFGLFQRLHSEEEFEGTGLGLANVRRIILRHGGRTWGEGAVDQGATFYFSLPKRKETP